MNIKKPHTALSLFLISFVLFIALALCVQAGLLLLFDQDVHTFLVSSGGALLTYIFLLINFLTTPMAVIITSALVVIFFLGRNMYKEVIIFILGLILSAASFWCLKQVFGIERPTDQLVNTFSEFAFPSGHVTLATTFLFLFGFLSFPKLTHRLKEEILFSSVFLIVLVAMSRLYLGVHWFSDVLGGLILGLSVSFLMIWIFDQFAKTWHFRQ